jgi:hypothetical protein
MSNILLFRSLRKFITWNYLLLGHFLPLHFYYKRLKTRFGCFKYKRDECQLKIIINSVAWVRERTVPTERPPLSSEVSVNFWGCWVVSVTVFSVFYTRAAIFVFFQVAPQLYSRGWVDPVSAPLLHRKSGSAGNRTRAFGSVARNPDHWTTKAVVPNANAYTEISLSRSFIFPRFWKLLHEEIWKI